MMIICCIPHIRCLLIVFLFFHAYPRKIKSLSNIFVACFNWDLFLTLMSTCHRHRPHRAHLTPCDCRRWLISLPAMCLHVSPSLSATSPSPPSLRSMRAKATKLCPSLPPLLRPSTRHCPSRPAPRWTTVRWRRSWRSASGCRWRCRGYGKKTNRSGWDSGRRPCAHCFWRWKVVGSIPGWALPKTVHPTVFFLFQILPLV